MTVDEMRNIIQDEIIVDCYGDEEVAVGWQTYLGDELRFPFQAKIKIKKRSGTSSLEKVDVLGEAKVKKSRYYEDPEITLEVSQIGSEQIFKIKIGELQDVVADEDTANAIEIWKFWQNGY